MFGIVLIFGLISGAISILMMLVTMQFVERIGFDYGEILGYTTLVASFLLIFFGIRRYREQAGGTLSFGRGFTVGILITLISCVIYVGTWLIVSDRIAPDFMDKYQAHVIAKERAGGATEAEIAAKTAEMKYYMDIYATPLGKMAFTFMEPFPVGLIVTLISAAVLRRTQASAAPVSRSAAGQHSGRP